MPESRKRYVITLTASNRVGILAAVATGLAELGGDLIEIKQTLLQQFFIMILSAEFPEHRDVAVISDHLSGICQNYGISVTIKDPDAEQAAEPHDPQAVRGYVKLKGADKPGTLRTIATRLAQDGIDITEMSAIRNGQGTFEMSLQLSAPAGTEMTRLEQELTELVGETLPADDPAANRPLFRPPNAG